MPATLERMPELRDRTVTPQLPEARVGAPPPRVGDGGPWFAGRGAEPDVRFPRVHTTEPLTRSPRRRSGLHPLKKRHRWVVGLLAAVVGLAVVVA